MIKTYNQRFYPNPFRYRKLNSSVTESVLFNEVYEKVKPFMADKFSGINNYFNEFNESKFQIRAIRVASEKITNNVNYISNKSKNFTKIFIQTIDKKISQDEYENNLRYLELPLQPFTDKKGFEIQTLSQDILEDLIDEVEDGFSYIYEYSTNLFPDPIEMWTDYALLNPKEFPVICHDDILEASYEVFDSIVDDLQKNSVNLFNWIITGDIESHLLRVFKSKSNIIKVIYDFRIIESILSISCLILIIKYLVSNYSGIKNLKQKKLAVFSIKKILNKIHKKITYKLARLKQKTRWFLLDINSKNFSTDAKYKVLQIALKV